MLLATIVQVLLLRRCEIVVGWRILVEAASTLIHVVVGNILVILRIVVHLGLVVHTLRVERSRLLHLVESSHRGRWLGLRLRIEIAACENEWLGLSIHT